MVKPIIDLMLLPSMCVFLTGLMVAGTLANLSSLNRSGA
jgi:hypothetical protein